MQRQVLSYIEDVWSQNSSYIHFKVDFETIERMRLEIGMHDIEKAILAQKKLKIFLDDIRTFGSHMRVYVSGGRSAAAAEKLQKVRSEQDVYARMTHLRRALPGIMIRGHADAQRAIIKTDEQTALNSLLVEGYGVKACMATDGVVGTRTRTNSVMEMRDVLGIEAARRSIIDEISLVLGDMDIDPRHMQLLADVMTCKGEVLGITRFGLAKMRDSVLQLASFEKTPDHLFDAAFFMKTDRIEGVSERIIMGQSMKVGTGAFQVVRSLNLRPNPSPTPQALLPPPPPSPLHPPAASAAPPSNADRSSSGADESGAAAESAVLGVGPKETVFEDCFADFQASHAQLLGGRQAKRRRTRL